MPKSIINIFIWGQLVNNTPGAGRDMNSFSWRGLGEFISDLNFQTFLYYLTYDIAHFIHQHAGYGAHFAANKPPGVGLNLFHGHEMGFEIFANVTDQLFMTSHHIKG